MSKLNEEQIKQVLSEIEKNYTISTDGNQKGVAKREKSKGDVFLENSIMMMSFFAGLLLIINFFEPFYKFIFSKQTVNDDLMTANVVWRIFAVLMIISFLIVGTVKEPAFLIITLFVFITTLVCYGVVLMKGLNEKGSVKFEIIQKYWSMFGIFILFLLSWILPVFINMPQFVRYLIPISLFIISFSLLLFNTFTQS